MRFINRIHIRFIYITFFLFILSNCQLDDPKKSHGINFLDNRAKVLVAGKTNKNDVIKLIGNPHSKSIKSDDTWIYFERTISKGKLIKLGRNVLTNNNVLELKFDRYGILKNKKLLSIEDMQKVSYSKKLTVNDISQKSFVEKFLSSVKQKMYGNKEK